MNELQCPACKGNAVTEINDDLLCLKCGNRENLYDFAIHKPECDPVDYILDENIQGEGGIGDRGYRGEGEVGRGYFTGRYTELPKIGYDETYQRNRRGIYAELRNLRSDIQEHFKEHKAKRRESAY